MSFISDCIEVNQLIYGYLSENWESEHPSSLVVEKCGTGHGGDESRRIDLIAEKYFIDKLSKYGKIDSEEAGEVGDGDFRIVIDPIDGSDNLVSKIPYYGSSVALINPAGTVVASIVTNLANGDIFYKDETGHFQASLLSDRQFTVEPNEHATLGIFEKAYAYSEVVSKLEGAGEKFRSPGALALSLAYAHRVRFMLFVGRAREYDIAAGLHQCQGMHINASNDYLLVARDGDIFSKVLSTIKEQR